MEIRRDKKAGKLWLLQKKCISKVLERFNMISANPVSTLITNYFSLSVRKSPTTNEEIEKMSKIPYANAVGCLLYAIVCIRLYIAQAVGVASKYKENLGKEHWNAVKWILRTLMGTKDLRIVFERKYGGQKVSLDT